ncbi:hypothetical protein [Epilithonimonas mollis]|nr:hypothetical protein [Epilithonimonas mollis]
MKTQDLMTETEDFMMPTEDSVTASQGRWNGENTFLSKTSEKTVNLWP